MNQLLSSIGESIYDQESKENVERFKSFLLQTKGTIMVQVSKLLTLSGSRCDGTIICDARDHKTKCYAYSATDKQWRREMSRILDAAN